MQSWFLDLNLVMAYWGSGAKRAYHHTAPINALYGLHEALVILEEEGLEVLTKELKKVDPLSYARVDLKNHMRVLKALEISNYLLLLQCCLCLWYDTCSSNHIAPG